MNRKTQGMALHFANVNNVKTAPSNSNDALSNCLFLDTLIQAWLRMHCFSNWGGNIMDLHLLYGKG